MSTTTPLQPTIPIILGSSSPWRQQVLRDMGITAFSVLKPDIDEKAVRVAGSEGIARDLCDPREITLAIARAKAEALLPHITTPHLLITGDQVVHYDGRIREKPTSQEECRRYLAGYAKEPAVTYSAVVVTHTGTGRVVEGVDIAKQHFKPIPDHIVDELLLKGDIMHCAGGFMVDDPLLEPYLGDRVGDEDSIMGLPVRLLRRLLIKAENAAPA